MSITREKQLDRFHFCVQKLLLQIFHMGQDHTQWDGCESALCSSALSNSHHDGISWNTANLSCFLFPSEEVKVSASRSLGYWCRQGLEQRTTMSVTLQISVNCPCIQLMKGKRGCSRYNRNMMNRCLCGGLFKAFAETLPIEQTMLKYACLLKVCLLSHGTYIQQETITLS